MGFFKKEKIEIIVDDTHTKLPDIKKIAVSDIKQYIVKAYEENRCLLNEKEDLNQQIEILENKLIEADNFKIIAEEYQKRDEENKEKIIKMENKVKSLETQIYDKNEIINTYKIKEVELNKMEENLQNEIEKNSNENLKTFKEKICEQINSEKGNISKSKICKLILNTNLIGEVNND